MRNVIITALIGLILSACTGEKKQEKDLLDNLLKAHDKVMGSDDALMKNKMKLDTLLKLPAKDSAEKLNIKAMDLKLQAAEVAMENWMGNFKPDVGNKTHDEIVKYYTDQTKQVMAVDSQMNKAIKESDVYLANKSK